MEQRGGFVVSRVSIPYRYKQNIAVLTSLSGNLPSFQSPIGTNKTYLNLMTFCSCSVFQSPIGTNKTRKRGHNIRRRKVVSIPYRYKQNLHTIQNQIFLMKVSIPYRYKQNRKGMPYVARLVLFQSPIGTNKTSLSGSAGYSVLFGFNPLQVQTKLHYQQNQPS